MESYSGSFGFASLQALLEELAALIADVVSHHPSKPWVMNTELDNIFREKYGVSITTALNAQVSGSDLRSELRRSLRFRIYATPNPQEFHIALLDETVPGGASKQQKPIQYRIKRPWKVDGRLTKMLRAEGAQEIPSRWSRPARRGDHQSPKEQPNLVPEIKSVQDFELALIAITKILITPQSAVEVATLYNKFCEYYGPIKAMMRQVCPGIKLINYLQTIAALDVREIDGKWQVTLNDQRKE